MVTADFLDALLERFKNQKLLHSKYTIMLLLAALKQFQAMPNIISIKTGEIPVRACVCDTCVCGTPHTHMCV